MQSTPETLRNFLNSLFYQLSNLRTRHMSKSFQKFKIALITKDISQGKLSQQPLQNYSSISRCISYASIKPSEEYYNLGQPQPHNYDAETIDMTQNLSNFDNKVTKENYFQKYLNQTFVEYCILWYFPVSQLIRKSIGNYDPEGLGTIMKSDYKEFFESLLAKRKSWGKLETPAHRLEYKRSMQTPLTVLKGEDHDEALEIFVLLFNMEADELQRPKSYYAAMIVNKIIKAGDQLREEIFLQLIKQMSNSQKHDNYLPLFIVICTVVKISLRMYIPLLHYLIHKSMKAAGAYTYLFYAVIKNFDNPRMGPITSFQALSIMTLRQIGITVCFPTEKTFYFEVHAEVEDVIREIVKFYELNPSLKYLLQYRGKYFQTGKMMDCFAEAVDDQELYSNFRHFQGYRVLIIFKNMVDSTLDKTNNDLLYSYCSSMYLDSLFTLTREEIIVISALKYYSENDALGFCEITRYIPLQYYKSHLDSNLEKQMVKSIQGITCTKSEARNKVLQILKTQDAFMSFIFEAEMFFGEEETEFVEINMYLKPGRLILVGRGGYSCYRHIRLSQVKKWGRSKKKLCLMIETFGKVYIESRYTDLIVEIFEEYVSTLGKYADSK